MAGYAHGDNNFSDDEFDDAFGDLPVGALAELEHNAIQLTQVDSRARLKATPSSDYGDDFDDEDLDDAVVIDESRSTAMPVHNRNNPGPASKRGNPGLQHYGNSGPVNLQRPNVPLFQPNRDKPAPPVVLRNSQVAVAVKQVSQVAGADETGALRKQLEELQKKNHALEQNINAKAGEVAIVRSKQEKEAKEHERELNALRKLSEEKLAKQRKELEAARIAANNAAIERDFVKQDLAESERVRKLAHAAEKKDLTVTPKKKKTLSHRDGFDDDEIETLSPSKLSPSKFRGQNGTPTKAGKRKRKAVESPAPALDVIHSEPSIEGPEQRVAVLDGAVFARLGIQDDRFDFLGTMLDHRPNEDHLRTIEALGTYALPSLPKETLSSVILGNIPIMGLKKPITELPIEFCELLISIWTKCLEQKYYKPLNLLIDWLTRALELKTTSIAPHIVDTLVPIAQSTADLVSIPRFQKKPLEGYDEVIDVGACLSILYLTALGCMSEVGYITRFWRLIRTDLVAMILSPHQPTEHFEIMLKLLSTSVLRDTFGSVSVDIEKNTSNTNHILDRLSHPLFEVPFLNITNSKMSTEETLKVRLQILQLMTSMTRSPFASHAMATHLSVVGRLVSLMSNSLDLLYDYQSGHQTSAQILTLATRLLYHLVTKYEKNINMQEKVMQVPGGSHKYLLVLARLNFSEDDLVLESCVAPDIPGLALEMLEGAVTPEEGDSILKAFVPS